MANPPKDFLQISVQGRIIDHFGIQMYQSPIASIAELISNSWDADAEEVKIDLPSTIESDSVIVVEDNGNGMTLDECESLFLNVGYCRRNDSSEEKSVVFDRPILGRKGIGKFAGFGIAKIIRVETISRNNGEKTAFELDIDQLRTDDYISAGGNIRVLEYSPPSEERKADHGTKIILKTLEIDRAPSESVFQRGMSRRFLLHQQVDNFAILINGNSLPESDDSSLIEFSFPRDYPEDRKPDQLTDIDAAGWGTETLPDGNEIRWRFLFYKDTIKEDEVSGISVFWNGKIAQTPFFFNLSGGVGGQVGMEYLTGKVEANYLDGLNKDIASPERQRINWGYTESQTLSDWGKDRIKTLLMLWKSLRIERRVSEFEDRSAMFAERLQNLPRSEQKVVRKTLLTLAKGAEKIPEESFRSIGFQILTAWEGGRLKEMMHEISNIEEESEEEILKILLESNVLTALHTAEAVKTKLDIIAGLAERIEKKELENAVRDFISDNPWLISPEWETFTKETSLKKIAEKIATDTFGEEEDWKARVDLILQSRDSLLLVEFMKPGKTVDQDHLDRFQRYVDTVRAYTDANTQTGIKTVIGYLVADNFDRKNPAFSKAIQRIERDKMYTLDWQTLLCTAASQWKAFLKILVGRAPEDERLKRLLENID